MMQFIPVVLLAIGVALSGCSAVQFHPQPKGQQMVVTKVKGATAQLIVSKDFQSRVVQVKPVGNKLGSAKLDVLIGAPVTKSLTSYLSSVVPEVRVGDVSDGEPTVVTVTPFVDSIEVGTDDNAAYRTGMFIPIASFAMTADAISSIKLSANVKYCNGLEKTVSATGHGLKNRNYSLIGFPELEEVSGIAIDDVANKISQVIARDLRDAKQNLSGCKG